MRTDDELETAAKHLVYERTTMCAAAAMALRSRARTPDRWIATDAMLIHARNLVEFLRNSGVFASDVKACHYVNGWQHRFDTINGMPVNDFVLRVHKLVAHISYERHDLILERVDPRWDYKGISDVIDREFSSFIVSLNDPKRSAWFDQ